eukprot:8893305-Pyramimonas_sp.AAC.1
MLRTPSSNDHARTPRDRYALSFHWNGAGAQARAAHLASFVHLAAVPDDGRWRPLPIQRLEYYLCG